MDFVYSECMITETRSMPLTRARDTIGDVIDTARSNHEPVYLERHGKPVAVLVGVDDFEHLIDLAEDMADITEARKAMEAIDRGEDPLLDFDAVAAELGW